MSEVGPASKHRFFFWKQLSVVGTSHHDFKGALHKIKQGAMLTLVRDVKNKYDAFAVEVREPATNQKVGYLARSNDGEVARFMDNGYEPKAYVQVCDGISLIINLWLEKKSWNEA